MNIIKTLFSAIVIAMPLMVMAQDSDRYQKIETTDVYLQTVPSKGCNLQMKYFLPMLDESLEQFLGGEVFGIEASFDQTIPLYYKKFKKVKKEELKNITVASMEISECYRIVPSEVICVKYQSAGMKTPADVSDAKYVTYDFKNKKVVRLADMVSAPVMQMLKEKGLDVENATNIHLQNDSLFINIGEVNLNIDINKFHTNLTDYALQILCRSREGYAAGTELPLFLTGNLPDFKNAEFPGGEEAMMKYLTENTHFPKGHQLPGMGGGRGMGMPPMGMPGGQPGGMPQMNNRVFIGYVVDTDGGLYSIRVIKGIDPYFDLEAFNTVVAMPKMEPATTEGKPVRQSFAIPVTFRPQFGGFGGFRPF